MLRLYKFREYVNLGAGIDRTVKITIHRSRKLTQNEKIVLGTTAIFASAGAYLNDPQANSTFAMALISGLSGFVLAHVPFVGPTIYKRCHLSQECKNTIKAITQIANDFERPLQIKVNQIIEAIMTSTKATEAKANISQTWGYRKLLIDRFYEQLTDSASGLLEKLNTDSVDQIKK